MKKNVFLAIILLLFLVLSISFLSACGEMKTSDVETLSASCIRIHIRANSNSTEDQAVKLKVRDAVTTYLTSALKSCKTKKQAYNTLDKNKQELVKIANSTLKQHGFEYKTTIRLNNEHFPERVYDGYDFPEGDYDALILELGTGKGDNWWCVAFPPLCFVPSGNSGEKIVYKSWIKEMLDKLFS